MKIKPPVIILIAMLAITLSVFGWRTYKIFRHSKESLSQEARYQNARELFDKTLLNEDRVEFELLGQERMAERMQHIRSDLAEVIPYIPEDELGALLAWESQSFLTAENYLAHPETLDDSIKSIPVEIHSRHISPEEIAFAHEKLKQAILVLSQNNFEDFIEFRGGAEVLQTEEDSENARENLERLQKFFSIQHPQTQPPSTLLEAQKLKWEACYAGQPYMDRVSLGGCFLAFYEDTPDRFDAERWQARVTDIPCELTDKAQEYGSLSRMSSHRILEYKVSPVQVMQRDGKLKYFDFVMNTGREGKLTFPVAFRFYYEPQSGRWLLARVHPFYSAGFGEEGAESPGMRPMLN